jgi:Putative transposase
MPHKLIGLCTCSRCPGRQYREVCARSLATRGTLGAGIGLFSVLHTWDQRPQHYPHIHCVIAAGGITPDYASWIASRRSFFLPVKVLSRVFRGKVLGRTGGSVPRWPTSDPRPSRFVSRAAQLHCVAPRSLPSRLGVYSKPPLVNRSMCCAISVHTLTAAASPTAD